MTIIKVTATAPKAVSTNRSLGSSGCLKSERERDRVEGRLVLGLRDREAQAPPIPVPAQAEEWAALPLDCEGLFDKLGVDALVDLGY